MSKCEGNATFLPVFFTQFLYESTSCNLFKEMQLFDSVSKKASRKAAFLEPLLCNANLASCQQSLQQTGIFLI